MQVCRQGETDDLVLMANLASIAMSLTGHNQAVL